MKMTMDQITAAHPDVAILESQADRELLAAVMEQLQAVVAENVGLKSAIQTHSESTHFCQVCGKDDPSCTDDVCYVLNETPATNRFVAEMSRQATEPLLAEIKTLKAMSVGDIRDLIDYNPETGIMKTKLRFSNRAANTVIGSQTREGYYAISLFGKKVFVHRLAWLLHYGEWPELAIDHINGIKTDNRISNLRQCTLSQNQFNRPMQKNNSTGVKGVYWNKRDKRFVASVQFLGKSHSAGRFVDLESAKQAVIELREKLAGEFANHGEYAIAKQLREVGQ